MDVKSVKLNKVNIIGRHCFHVFDNGKEIQTPCTSEEYRALAELGAARPTLDGAIWKYSYEDNLYDTPSGFLEEGTYYDEEGVQTSAALINGKKLVVPKEDIVGDKITDSGILFLGENSRQFDELQVVAISADPV